MRATGSGTFAWNTQEHLEAYLAVPCMGAVLHTLNLRLFPEQLTYVVNHAEDKVDPRRRHAHPPAGQGGGGAQDGRALHRHRSGRRRGAGRRRSSSYEELLAAEEPGFDWPEVDERSAAAMCYTSGTTGNPKGVVYSHRSTFLHSLAAVLGSGVRAQRGRPHPADRADVPRQRLGPPLRRAGWPAPTSSCRDRFLQAEPLCRLIEDERPTISGAVPTVWNDILRYAEPNAVDLSSLRPGAVRRVGGPAQPDGGVPGASRRADHPGLGHDRDEPAGGRRPPAARARRRTRRWTGGSKTGRVVAGVELRIVDDDGTVLPWDGEAVGEIQVRGPWITARYYLDDDPAKFDDGWLRTGDVGSVDA